MITSTTPLWLTYRDQHGLYLADPLVQAPEDPIDGLQALLALLERLQRLLEQLAQRTLAMLVPLQLIVQLIVGVDQRLGSSAQLLVAGKGRGLGLVA